MKLLFDENLSPRLARDLQALFPGSVHVAHCGLVIVSKDGDFHDISVFRGSPPKVVWLRAGNCSTSQIQNILERAKSALEAFTESGDTVMIIRPQRSR
ncbi:MAG TPA: DUF5615 family PIN-like protein [Bryobacteraceae bacterium]